MTTGFFIVPQGTNIHTMPAADLDAALYTPASSPVCNLPFGNYDVIPVGSPVLVQKPAPFDALPASTATYALRRTTTAYTGSCIRVRRASDNTEQDIGFTNALGLLDTTALTTFVGSQNLITRSEEFNNAAWSKTVGLTVTTDAAVAPDGTTTADRIVPPNGTGNAAAAHAFTYQASVYNASCYAKADGYNFVQFYSTAGASSGFVNFDLTTGAVTNSSLWTGSAQNVGNGWWRLSVVTSAMNAVSSNIGCHVLVTGSEVRYPNTITTDGTSGILLWGFQLSIGSALQPYTATTTTARDGNGFVTTWYDQGRHSHAVRRNLLTRTERFENAVWDALPTPAETISVNAAVAPDGTTTAELLTVTSTTSSRAQIVTGGITAGTTVTASIYVKRGAVGDWMRMAVYSVTNTNSQFRCWINMATGALGTVSALGNAAIDGATITDVGNGWYRVSITGRLTVDSDYAFLAPSANGDNVTTRTIGHERLLWGAQLEIGGTLTAYQPILAGANCHLTQTTAANQPSIMVNGLVTTDSGRPSILVSATSFMQNNFGDFVQPFTRSYVITRKDNVAVGSNSHYISSFGSIPNTTEFGNLTTQINQYAGGTPNPQTIQPFILGETAVFTSIYNNAASGMSLVKNGAVLTGPFNAGATQGYTGARIGFNATGTGAAFGIGELIIHDGVLSPADRQSLQQNQGAYNGIAIA